MRTLLADLRLSFRQLRKSPGFTSVAVLTLALGIGANTLVYSVVHAVLLNRLPFPKPEQLVVMAGDQKGQDFSVSYPDLLDWQQRARSFTAMAGFDYAHFEYFDGDHATLPRAMRVSAPFFSILGASPALGRTFSAEDDSAAGAPTVVLSHEFWQNQLHGRPADRRSLARPQRQVLHRHRRAPRRL